MTWGLATATVRFGTRVAIDNLSFDVNRSAVTVIVGGDGAGKSTALRALVGLVRLDAGQARRPAKGDIGYIPATGGIYLDLTVEENLAFSGARTASSVTTWPIVCPTSSSGSVSKRLGVASAATFQVVCDGSWRSPWRSCTVPVSWFSTSPLPESIP